MRMKIRIPDENAPGFLRREQLRVDYLNAEDKDKIRAMVAWLSEYIADEDPVQALENASEADILDLMQAIRQVGADPKGSENTEDG
jgi:hypothetical protein